LSTILILAVVFSLVCLAIHKVTRPGNLLAFLSDATGYSWFSKPLFDCLLCMGGIWSLVQCAAFHYRYGFADPAYQIPLICILTIGINGFISILMQIASVHETICFHIQTIAANAESTKGRGLRILGSVRLSDLRRGLEGSGQRKHKRSDLPKHGKDRAVKTKAVRGKRSPAVSTSKRSR